jgi:5-formyltetrahydrofolate cyclo-ligase
VNGEINLSNLWQSAPLQGKYCYFPALNEDLTLSFLPAKPTSPFIENRYGIKEPDITRDQAIPLEQLDIIFVPLVAVDPKGTRLGMGAGYYDRTLKNGPPPLLIGVAYEFQRLSFIMAREWDVPLNVVITEDQIYWSES